MLHLGVSLLAAEDVSSCLVAQQQGGEQSAFAQHQLRFHAAVAAIEDADLRRGLPFRFRLSRHRLLRQRQVGRGRFGLGSAGGA